MITLAVCDDNPQFARLLRMQLQKLCINNLPERIDYNIAPAFGSGEDVLEFLQKGNTIDVLFLDIDMPHTDGFTLAKMLCDTYPNTIIIFVSSYEEFVYSSFEYCPFRFLRKAHLSQELEITFQKVIEKCILNNESLTFDTTDGEVMFRVNDVLYFEGQKNYFYIYTLSGKTYKCRGTMESVDLITDNLDFFRIHSAYVVNLEHIDTTNNKGYLTMKNNQTLSISKRRLPAFKDEYMKFTRRRFSK